MEEKRLVVLYSTTRAPLPLHSEVYLDVISKTLDYFKNNTDRFLLIWRSHPFLRNELAERYPAFLSEYDETVAQFRREGWGRFSISESIDELVEVSDVWYGYYSDVTEKFRKAGKKVIIQSFCEEYNFEVGITKYENYIYGSFLGRNAVIRFDLDNGRMEYVARFPNQKDAKGVLFHRSDVINNEIVFSPFLGKDLYILNPQTNMFRVLELDIKEELQTEGRGDFMRSILWEDEIYLLPFGYRAIVCVNLKTGECRHKAYLAKYYPKDRFPYLFTAYIIRKGCLFLPSIYDNSVFCFSFENAKTHVYYVGTAENKFNDIVLVGEMVYLVIKNALGIIEWNPDTMEETLYDDFPKGAVGHEKHCFNDTSTKLYNNQLFLLPAGANMAVKFDLKNKKFQKLSCFDPYLENTEATRSVFDTSAISDKEIYVISQREQLIRYNCETDSLIEYDFRLNQETETAIELSELDEYSRS